MTPQEIRIGTRLELELLNNVEEAAQIYVSQLLEIQGSGTIVVSSPIYEARLIFIPPLERIRLAFVHNEYGLLAFNATVTATQFKGKIAVLIVQPEPELFKLQRRKYYRLDYLMDIKVKINEKKSNNKNEAPIRAFTKNISGCGLCIVTEIDIPKNTELEVELKLPEDITIIDKCIVVRKTWFEVMKSKCYELGLCISDISKKDQDILIKYIYEQQRVRLKKETHL